MKVLDSLSHQKLLHRFNGLVGRHTAEMERLFLMLGRKMRVSFSEWTGES